MSKALVYSVACLLPLAFGGYVERVYHAPVASIAANQEFWVDSGDSPRDFQVGLGTLQQTGDEIKARYRRRLTGPVLEYIHKQRPQAVIPNGSEEWIEGAITCGDTPTEKILKDSVRSPKGRFLFSLNKPSGRLYNEAASNYFLYNRTAAGLVCWSVARKCESKDLAWPPPKELFDAWPPARGAKVAAFVPACRLTR